MTLLEYAPLGYVHHALLTVIVDMALAAMPVIRAETMAIVSKDVQSSQTTARVGRTATERLKNVTAMSVLQTLTVLQAQEMLSVSLATALLV